MDPALTAALLAAVCLGGALIYATITENRYKKSKKK